MIKLNPFDEIRIQTFYLVENLLGENMLNQNIATIVASFIAVIGTLGGAITGVLLSNRHTSKMEQLRIEQEKAKRNTAIIEEVYMLLNKIETQIYKNVSNLEVPEMYSDDLDRVRTLIYLYLPSQKQKFDDFSKSITNLALALSRVEGYDRQEELQCFMNCFNHLQSSLEKLVR